VVVGHLQAQFAGRAFRVPSRGSFVHGFRPDIVAGPSANEENLGTRAGYPPGFFLAIDNNHGKEKVMTKSPAEITALKLLSKIEDVAFTVKNDLESLAGIIGVVDDTETNLDDLRESAELLCREIVDTLPADPVAIATIEAIDNLLALLLQAKTHLEGDELLAALGTLQPFDFHADDLKAAIRLTVVARRRSK
jgi:hypothetical protein